MVKSNNFNFKYNISGLTYDESNSDTYIHFVYHYLKNYYVDSRNSLHYINGGNWTHDNYDPQTQKLHESMIKNKGLSVRDLILLHLISGSSVRMYGVGQSHRYVKPLDNNEQIIFWKFVLDSKMLDINEPFVISSNMKKYLGEWTFLNNMVESTKSIFDLVFLKCWRDNNLQLLNQLTDTYKFNINNYVSSIKFGLPKLIYTIHDHRIHSSYNNGVSCRLRSYYRKLLSKHEMDEIWQNISADKFVMFVNFLRSKFTEQLSKVSYYDFKYVFDENTEIFENVSFDEYIKFVIDGDSKESCQLLLEQITGYEKN